MEFLSNIFGDAAQAYKSYVGGQSANQAAAAQQQTAQTKAVASTNWVTIGIIGAVMLVVVIVALAAFRK